MSDSSSNVPEWATPSPTERRATPRLVPPPSLAATAVFVGPPALRDRGLEILDVSTAGLGILVDADLPVPDLGERLEVHLFLPGNPLPCRLKGRLRNTGDWDGRVRMGIELSTATVGIGDKHRRNYKRYLDQCRDALVAVLDGD